MREVIMSLERPRTGREREIDACAQRDAGRAMIECAVTVDYSVVVSQRARERMRCNKSGAAGVPTSASAHQTRVGEKW